MDGLLENTAGDVMTEKPTTISADALAQEAVAIMNDRKITCLFVTDANERAEGVLHILDCLRIGLV